MLDYIAHKHDPATCKAVLIVWFIVLTGYHAVLPAFQFFIMLLPVP